MGNIARTGALLAVLALDAGPAAAQMAQAGTVLGGARLPSSLTETGASVVLQLQPVEWLTVGTHPTWVRVAGSDAAGRFSSTGLTDLPLELGVWHQLPGPLSPGLGASLGVTLPTGDTAQGLGSGQTSVGASVGGTVRPVERLALGVDVWRPLTGAGWSSAFSSTNATSLSLEATLDLSEHASAHGGFTTDLGAADSLGTPRSLTAGVSLPLARHIALTLDGSRGLTRAAPAWALSVGIGSAFEGLNPLGMNSPVRRLATALGGSVNRGNGKGNVGGFGRGHKLQ